MKKGIAFHTKWTADPAGGFNLEVVSDSHAHLVELEETYKKQGYKTWVNPWGFYDNSWVLTVGIGRAA